MAYDPNVSPTGWYVVSYLLRFVELADPGNEDPKKRFSAWENTVLVKALTLDEAFAKATKIARAEAKPYRGGEGVPVKWTFEGITNVLPVYEEIADGAEIMWESHAPRKLKTLRTWVRKKQEFSRSGTRARRAG